MTSQSCFFLRPPDPKSEKKNPVINNSGLTLKFSKQVVQSQFFVCFVALRPKSTAMVMAGQSVHLTTLFPGQA